MYDIARLRIGLADMPRPVVRMVEVPLAMRLDDLHLVVQTSMGWERRHGYQFRTGGSVAFGRADPRNPVRTLESVTKSTLADLCAHLNANRTFEYVYDFEDRWVHRVKLQAVGESDPDLSYPRLLSAKRCCPPEDCGGSWGYARYLESVADPVSVGFESRILDDFDPDVADVARLRDAVEQLAARLEAKRGPTVFNKR